MLTRWLLKSAVLLFIFTTSLLQAEEIPHIQKAPIPQLMVAGKPFIILGGELGNSTASSTEYMKSVWPKLRAMNLNTVLVPVYWDLIEPEQGKFNFTLVDDLLKDARTNHVKVVILWFGSWKNSMSTYTPAWIKRNPQKYELAKNQVGINQEILSPFDPDNLKADVRAYSALLAHLKKVDAEERTVLMMQVENEIGMLPDARDYHPEANRLFNMPAPIELMEYLQRNKQYLEPRLEKIWSAQGYKTTGTWRDIFGDSIATDEIFMAWYFARYTEAVAAAGKNIYALPTYVNAALNRPGVPPGQYPSGGPLPHILDIWKAAAPHIDLFSPDFYNPDFTLWNDQYTRNGAALFIPEIRFEPSNAAKAFYALGHYGAIGFSPFSIESTDKPDQEPIGKAYAILQSLIPEIAKAKSLHKLQGALVDKTQPQMQFSLGSKIFTVKHDYTLGWSPEAKNEIWPEAGVLIIQEDDENFWVSGTGVVITVTDSDVTKHSGIDFIYEGKFKEGKWHRLRNLNGDENHQGRHLRIPTGEIATQELRLFTYPKQ